MVNLLVVFAFGLGILIYLLRKFVSPTARLLLSRIALYTAIVGVLGLHVAKFGGYKLPTSVILIGFSIAEICLSFEGAYLGIQLNMMKTTARNKVFASIGALTVGVLCFTAQTTSYLSIALALIIVICLFLWIRRIISSRDAVERFLNQRIANLEQFKEPEQ